MAGPLAFASWFARRGHAIRSWLRLGRPGWVGAIGMLHVFAQVALAGVMLAVSFDGAPAFVSKRLLLLLTLPFGRATVPVVELASSPVGEVDIHALLGPEDPGWYRGHRYELIYDLGQERAFLDEVGLRVSLGEDGRGLLTSRGRPHDRPRASRG